MAGMTMNYIEKQLKAGKIRGYKIIAGGQAKEKKKSKYGNKKVILDEFEFDSKKEANRYFELKVLMLAGEITDLQLQVEYKFEIDGKKIASYIADFVYKKKEVTIVEDVKSTATRKIAVYRLKKKLMKVINNIEIKEV